MPPLSKIPISTAHGVLDADFLFSLVEANHDPLLPASFPPWIPLLEREKSYSSPPPKIPHADVLSRDNLALPDWFFPFRFSQDSRMY